MFRPMDKEIIIFLHWTHEINMCNLAEYFNLLNANLNYSSCNKLKSWFTKCLSKQKTLMWVSTVYKVTSVMFLENLAHYHHLSASLSEAL